MFLSETRTYISITNRLRQWTSILHSHWSKPLSLIRPIRRKPKDFCWTKKCRQYQLINYLYLKERILKNCRKSHRWRSQNSRMVDLDVNKQKARVLSVSTDVEWKNIENLYKILPMTKPKQKNWLLVSEMLKMFLRKVIFCIIIRIHYWMLPNEHKQLIQLLFQKTNL